MKYENFGRYLLRKPLFSNQLLFENLKTKNLDDLVNELIDNNEFAVSIYWSSPELYNLIINYRNNDISEEKKARLINTLKKYAIRICSRYTPYGTMAGVTLKQINSENDSDTLILNRKARIDIEFLNELKLRIESLPYVRKHLRYKINNTAFKIAGQYKYYEPTISENEEYQTSSLEASEFLDRIFNITELTLYNDLHSLFSNEFTNDEICIFLDELIDNKFLVSELQLKITTNNLNNLKEVLSRLSNEFSIDIKQYIDIFDKLETCIKIIENTEINYLPEIQIKEIRSIVESLGIDVQHIFHVDLLHNSKSNVEVNINTLTNINSVLSILQNFKRPNSFYDELEHFKQIFQIKYDAEEICLMEALDDEYGIGFPATNEIGNLASSKLIEGKNKKETKKKEVDLSYLDYLIDIIEKNEDFIIDLNKHNLKAIKNSTVDYQSFCIIGECYKENIFIQSISSSNSILGRFALLDEKIEKLCQDIANKESNYNSDIIYAELLYLPEKRIGNIVRRPVLSKYEIPFFIDSSNSNNKIPLNDIFVSIRNNEIVLRSKKYNKRVIPRLSNAHNFLKNSNSVYRFLCYLQFQNESSITLDIDYSYFKKKYIPRIVYKNIILHRAAWLFYEQDINSIKNSSDPITKIKSYIKNWNISQYVLLVQGDNELFIDTSNNSYLSLLISEFKTKKIIQLSECLYKCESKIYSNEQVILPLYNLKAIPPISQYIPSYLQRSFMPGSEWIYIKIYCNSNITDKILSQEISPLLSSFLSDKLIKGSFFIRYNDPHCHIRLRLHLVDKISYSKVLLKLYESLNPYLQNRELWNIQLDSYHRELERYDSQYMEETEKAFFYDTLLILKLLEKENFIEDESFRLFSAIKNIDYWLSLFNLSIQEKLDFSKRMEAYYSSEFDISFKNHISSKYREIREELDSFFETSIFETFFLEREKYLRKLKLNRNKLPDYIHMSLNRWFNSEQRALELMAYAFAVKQYSKNLSYSK